MTTVIFVHGTGVRETEHSKEYSQTFETIKAKIRTQRLDIEVIPCLWGNDFGAKLAAKGMSIYRYDETLAITKESEDKEIVLWAQLYQNPLYELELLALKPQKGQSASVFSTEDTPGDELHAHVQALTAEGKYQPILTEAGIASIFIEARNEVIKSSAYNQIKRHVSKESFSEYSNAVARAIVATAIFIAQARELYPPILTDANLRDKVVEKISLALSEEELGVGSWVLGKIGGLASHHLTNYVEKKRGDVTNKISPMPCDILLYQTRGEKIRDFIETKIRDASKASPPVVLIAHSLGGIACVDLLVEKLKEQKPLEDVKLLITAGSQAPFLYEINALYSLEFGEPLPEKFPKWLNFYDQRDFLSYTAGKIFNQPNQRIQDVEIVSRLPFPQSHGAYWTNSTTWTTIFQELP